MKKYKVIVDGQEYEVGIEALSGEELSAPKAAPAAPAKPAAAAAAGGEAVNSPMPGTILAVNVKAGDAVKKGQALMILEAMKMENEINAPKDGVVAAVHVSKGQAVESGSLLCTLQ
ncbi:MAG: biotin/lipoyl-binding protein [Clostridiales bacterium]|nr:biotin/lipoyl-binding protein [Clostridiales bacterium]